ncbi:2-polyprenyl-6-methoxyphenol hydroxylase-like FAD-dependent oxidoreductase [Actinoplanes octamycinicus]|uniref:2-polyprenyl-6-methoxyphenol hydroxylase-like FAD-dependent oxidoreductase n=1 Tax=Actinoplanes octamycinicus TaxID=135948 RepID=A0A7W7M8N4_9ACTN|nr:FAD-dependent monooxygenase [Actinoplanes octamycinicus]MBB4740985.1 2-polyprenyl-6-methoxyphenol hydroxylase-like FAD-dependent oxidoreductase [Actinoplanes octamycinicus]GIE55892.1 FAD-dependent oxidoreductase [Actinoplanes octamycinicus]
MSFDVVIVGGGPNGLMLACELALNGVRPLLLERRTGPSTEQRANGLVGQIVPMLHRRGLYERLTGRPGGPEPAPGHVFGAFALHLAGISDNPMHILLAPQQKIESMLAERAAELGVQVRSGHELTGLDQKDDRVVADVTGPDGAYRIEARYLVGADGGRSVTRKLTGFAFPGVTDDHSVSRTAVVDVPAELLDPETGGLLIPGYGRVPPFQHHRTERGMVAFAPFPDGRKLITVATTARPAGDAPVTLAEVLDTLHYVLGVAVPLRPPTGPEPHTLRRLAGGNSRIADHYRRGRVILLGDAAHVHSAIGGPGLNLGLQDAINLGWKLAAQVHHRAPAGLLDTYESERRPVAERVVMHTQAQSVLAGPGPAVTALRALFAELLEEEAVVRRLAALIAGTDFRYDGVAGLAPDLGALTHAGRPLLVDNTGTLAGTVAPWRDRVELVTASLPSGTAMLVRPDTYVAWSSDDPVPDTEGLVTALTRWFGGPQLSI